MTGIESSLLDPYQDEFRFIPPGKTKESRGIYLVAHLIFCTRRGGTLFFIVL